MDVKGNYKGVKMSNKYISLEHSIKNVMSQLQEKNIDVSDDDKLKFSNQHGKKNTYNPLSSVDRKKMATLKQKKSGVSLPKSKPTDTVPLPKPKPVEQPKLDDNLSSDDTKVGANYFKDVKPEPLQNPAPTNQAEPLPKPRPNVVSVEPPVSNTPKSNVKVGPDPVKAAKRETPKADAPDTPPTSSSDGSFTKSAWKKTFSKSSLAQHHDLVQQAAKKYNVPFHVAAGIMAHETGRGRSDAWNNKNNPGGIMDPQTNWKQTKTYRDAETGIDDAVRVMSKNYNRAGGDLEKMGQIYAPVGADNDPKNLNKNWYSGVTKFSSNFKEPEKPQVVAKLDDNEEKESGPTKKRNKVVGAVINELTHTKHNVPRTAAMSDEETDRKKVQYVDRENDRKSSMSKQARQAAYKTNIIDEEKIIINSIIRETIQQAVAEKSKVLKKKTVAIPVNNLNNEKDVNVIEFNPDIKKLNPNGKISEDSVTDIAAPSVVGSVAAYRGAKKVVGNSFVNRAVPAAKFGAKLAGPLSGVAEFGLRKIEGQDTATAAKRAGVSSAGGLVGGAIGAGLGSFVPGIGTAIGAGVGGAAGSWLANKAYSAVTGEKDPSDEDEQKESGPKKNKKKMTESSLVDAVIQRFGKNK